MASSFWDSRIALPRISTMYVMPALCISAAAGRRYPAGARRRRLPRGRRPTGRKRASAPPTSRVRGVGRLGQRRSPVIDRHLLAAISLGGTLLDLIGGLYLA